MNKMRYLRIAVAGGVLLITLGCTAANLPLGTLCALCPVGFVEVALASGSAPWGLALGVAALLLIVLLLGRAFCSWLCPTSLIRNLFGGRTPRGLIGRTGSCAGCAADAANPNIGREHSNLAAQAAVLVALLVVSLIVHFPVFCLMCPIGLAFGTLFAISRLFVTWQPGWDLIVFPAMLLAEALLLRRWCAAVCPLGFFFGLMEKARAHLTFLPRPHARAARCIHHEGCNVCATVCPENISAATANGHDLEDCTFCLDCKEHCPTKAIVLATSEESARETSDETAQPS